MSDKTLFNLLDAGKGWDELVGGSERFIPLEELLELDERPQEPQSDD